MTRHLLILGGQCTSRWNDREKREKENKEQQRLTIDPLPTHVGAMGRALQATSNATVEKGDLMSREVACRLSPTYCMCVAHASQFVLPIYSIPFYVVVSILAP
jgi:hypothetical protein